jgi:hypothetical protein
MPIQPVGMFSIRHFTCAGTIHIATMVPVESRSKWLAHPPCEVCRQILGTFESVEEDTQMSQRVRVGVRANTTKQTQSPKYRRTRLEKDSAKAQEANTLLLDGSSRPETVHVVTWHGLTEILARLRKTTRELGVATVHLPPKPNKPTPPSHYITFECHRRRKPASSLSTINTAVRSSHHTGSAIRVN